MNIVEKAWAIATEAHKTQVRKDDGSPYILHPIAVQEMLRDAGADEVTQAAALVHDVLEDQPRMTAEVEALGEEILKIVQAVSEDKSLVWEERKKAYVETVRNWDERVKLVSIGDKIHNIENMVEKGSVQGEAFWKKFSRPLKDQQWFFTMYRDMMVTSFNHPLVARLSRAVDALNALS